MKGIILAGGEGTALVPLANYVPTFAFQLLGQPLLIHQIRSLQQQGIQDIAVVLGRAHEWQEAIQYQAQEAGCDISRLVWSIESEARGTAGALRPLAAFIGNDDCCVVAGGVFLGGVDLGRAAATHRTHPHGMTVGIRRVTPPPVLECLRMTEEGLLKEICVLHISQNRRMQTETVGLYWLGPSVLASIPDSGYMDLKEQLLPLLVERGHSIHTHDFGSDLRLVRSLEEYWELHRHVLFNDRNEWEHHSRQGIEMAEQVWIGHGSVVAPSARLHGPLVIGDGCVIGEHAMIIGPTAIGSWSRIGSHVTVRESILWNRTHLSDEVRIEYSILTDDAKVSQGERVRHTVVFGRREDRPGSLSHGLAEDRPPAGCINASTTLQPLASRAMTHKFSQLAKRGMDITIAGCLLLVICPVGFLIAAAIKLDSDGPVFYSQRRCTKDGQEFAMYKFRTMVPNAEQMHSQLLTQNELDGPVFKITRDPRITRVGAVLRETSLDEIPQLFNVLTGEMSLVGPRPLTMSEMRYCPGWRDIRLMVKGGVTGLWQLDGRNSTAFHEWVKHDIAYVKGQSLALDFKIILKTTRNVLYALMNLRHQRGP